MTEEQAKSELTWVLYKINQVKRKKETEWEVRELDYHIDLGAYYILPGKGNYTLDRLYKSADKLAKKILSFPLTLDKY